MDANEWCAIAHVDFRPAFADRQALIAALQAGNGPTFEEGERALSDFVGAANRIDGMIEVAVLQQALAENHFDVISRLASEAAYEAHLSTTPHLTYRRGIASVLGSLFENRLHGPCGDQTWPRANLDDLVVITQIEVQPPRLADALSTLDELVAGQLAAVGMMGQVLLQRHHRRTNLELISVWSSGEEFDEHTTSRAAQSRRSALAVTLVAPIEDRRHRLFAGQWAAP